MKKITVSQELGDKIISLYLSGMAPGKISPLVNLSNSYIAKYLRNKGIPSRSHSVVNRRYKMNENFFESIDTQEKAYILGFLYADGCVHENPNKVTLELHYQDVEILEKISNLIYIDKKPLLHRTFINENDRYRLEMSGEKITNDLIDKGCFHRKTLILKFPTIQQVPEHLQHHFIRGYFDGDGSVFTFMNTKWLQKRVNFTGTVSFISSLQDLLIVQCNMCKRKIEIKGKVSMLNISKKSDVIKVREYLYADSTIYLERKYNKFYDLNQDKCY